MQISAERLVVPRPIQRPSDVEKRPVDFGIEPPPAAPAPPVATIIKPAVSPEPEIVAEPVQKATPEDSPKSNSQPEADVDDFDRGIV